VRFDERLILKVVSHGIAPTLGQSVIVHGLIAVSTTIGTIVPGTIVLIGSIKWSMDLKDVLATNLRRIRHAKKLTQEALAERAELSPRYIGKIEGASTSPTVTVLGRLAEALEIDACELIRVVR
jgi:DNA-binding XRE family transcriptional regulator